MYDRAETQAANDDLWALVRAELGFGPDRLNRELPLWDIWEDPDLVLAQTCNLPYRLRLRGKVQIVGHPEYALPGCPPGHYNSVLIARQDDPRALEALLRARVVINQDHSQSGHVSIWSHAEALGIKPNIIGESGGHVVSAAQVAGGEADIAAIDAQSWRLIQRYDPQSARLREIERTVPTPATPFVCGLRQDVQDIRAALSSAIDALPAAQRAVINLQGLVQLPESACLDLPTPAHLQASA
ncbi:phosphate/phosphite/phosphonate ABC transporter substrate-binding protein [Primorskyibacter sp. 2E233]|uniref:phosphate/phosphite/phosphonate ABC transporter substrate-binding protein n=1 Tax=Primorskyibacter sp. 2E233 TaxID=3413431 RepID=UPI003BF2103E